MSDLSIEQVCDLLGKLLADKVAMEMEINQLQAGKDVEELAECFKETSGSTVFY